MVRSISLFPLAAMACLAPPALAQGWEKTFVVSWLEPAFYYDPIDKSATSGEAPGRDCAKGLSPYPDYRTLLKTSYRTQEEVDYFLDPDRRAEPNFDRATYGLRGPNGEDVYKAPWSVPDVPYPHPTSAIAYGFNLDGDETTGYTSPEGVKGVDNAFYMVAGCVAYWRGPARTPDGFKYANEEMLNGDYTVLIRLAGTGADPMNDANAVLSFLPSTDKIVRDASGDVAHDYSFRVDAKRPDYASTIKVAIRNGVIETTGPQTIRTHDWRHKTSMELEQSQLKLSLKPDGSLEGYFGGYRKWDVHYRNFSYAIAEYIMRLNLPAFWYSLRREADGLPDETGANTGISTVFRVSAVPAFATNVPVEAAAQVAAR